MPAPDDGHFAAFSFVDRITAHVPGTRARGFFSVPPGIREFQSSLVAEAVGQLAAWVAMAKIDFRGRPVAALAQKTLFKGDIRPGDMLELGVEIEDCDDDAVAYGGMASVGGATVIELQHCLGPMLPVAEFDSPDALRERFELLLGEGAPAGRFGGVAEPMMTILDSVPGASARATLAIPSIAPYFADHFPRRAVFPATLLLSSQIRLATGLARGALPAPPGMALVAAHTTNVKMRAFILPGQTVEIGAEVKAKSADSVATALCAEVDGRTVATARLQFALRAR